MTRISLFLGGDHDCSYLPGQVARSAFVDPVFSMTSDTYSALVAQGFRRSGSLIYRPHCLSCSSCLPARISADDFLPTRSQRRAVACNQDLSIEVISAEFTEEHYRLFTHYQAVRHEDGSMANMSCRECSEFLTAPWGVSRFVEFRGADRRLLALAVIDELIDGFSAVYTFYDPHVPQRGLGSYAILWQLAEAKRRGMPWVYLGFWIAACPKMAYKNRFRPLEVLLPDGWARIP